MLINTAFARAEIRVGDLSQPLAQPGLIDANLPATAGKVVLVDFWASWCTPCKMSFPAYARLNSEIASKRFVIVTAVSADQDPVSYASFVRKLSLPFSGRWTEISSWYAQRRSRQCLRVT